MKRSTKGKRGRRVAIETWGMAAIALGLHSRRPDLTQEQVVVAAIRYMKPLFDQAARELGEDRPASDDRALQSRTDSVLQHLRDMEHKRMPFTKAVRQFYDPRAGLDLRPFILEAIEGAMETLTPAN